MEKIERAQKQLQELLSNQKLAVLSTELHEHPYASLVGFVVADEARSLIFATARSTRKFANLSENNRIAMLIDSRSNQEADFHEAIAATAVGRAEEVPEDELDAILELYLKKHPHLVDFVKAPTCALVRMKVECYYLVSRFQNVVELHVS